MMTLTIRADLTAEELRDRACRERDGRASRRMLAIANALDGMIRAEAARAAGMERQALRDAVRRYNAEGMAGLHDRGGQGRPPLLEEGEVALLADRIYRGPDPKVDGVSAWTLPDLCGWIEQRFAKSVTPQSLSRILRREGFSRQKVRPTHPKADPKAQARFQKGGSPTP